MPTHEELSRFGREFARLPDSEKRRFVRAVRRLAEGIDEGRVPSGLRVKRIRSADGIWEISYSGDGRATFEWESGSVIEGKAHIRWHRIGGHEVLKDPRAH